MFPTPGTRGGGRCVHVIESNSYQPSSLHNISCQHTAASDDIHINNCKFISVKIYLITLKMNQNRSETCAYVTPRALSIELNVLGIWTECLFVQSFFVCLYACLFLKFEQNVCLCVFWFLISEQNVCLYTD